MKMLEQPLKLTAERLRSLFRYEPESGFFFFLTPSRKGNRRVVGALAIGGLNKNTGYAQLRVDGRMYYKHRLAFLWMTGAWPVNEIDHINGIRADNRWLNLRDVTRGENMQNQRRARSNSKSGVLGVWMVADGRWSAYIGANGRQKNLGYFQTLEAAKCAYLSAKKALHPAAVFG